MKKEEILSQLKEAQELISRSIAALGSSATPAIPQKSSVSAIAKHTKVDYTPNARNFVKTYGRGMNGQKKFVLLLAYLTKGKVGLDAKTNAVVALWRKMTAKELLGYAYNDKYPTAAKTNGWIDSKKRGTYHLCNTWMKIFS